MNLIYDTSSIHLSKSKGTVSILAAFSCSTALYTAEYTLLLKIAFFFLASLSSYSLVMFSPFQWPLLFGLFANCAFFFCWFRNYWNVPILIPYSLILMFLYTFCRWVFKNAVSIFYFIVCNII